MPYQGIGELDLDGQRVRVPEDMPAQSTSIHAFGDTMDLPDEYLQEREAEKMADLESLADALSAFRQLRRELDLWERVHLARRLIETRLEN